MPGSPSPTQCCVLVPFVEFPVANQSHGPVSYSVYERPIHQDFIAQNDQRVNWIRKWYLRTFHCSNRESDCQGWRWRTRGNIQGFGTPRPSISGRWSSSRERTDFGEKKLSEDLWRIAQRCVLEKAILLLIFARPIPFSRNERFLSSHFYFPCNSAPVVKVRVEIDDRDCLWQSLDTRVWWQSVHTRRAKN